MSDGFLFTRCKGRIVLPYPNRGQPGWTCILTGMAYDEWEQEYHLTDGGWLRGSFYFRGTLARKIPTPGDRVLTLMRESSRSQDALGLQTTWRQNWTSVDYTQEQICSLMEKFGHRPAEIGVPATKSAESLLSVH